MRKGRFWSRLLFAPTTGSVTTKWEHFTIGKESIRRRSPLISRPCKITPDNAEVYSNLGSAYIDQGGAEILPLAEQALKKSIALSPGYPAYANLGMLYMQERRYAEAATATEQALKINGNDYMVWNNLMLADEERSGTDKAVAARRKAEELAEKIVQLKPRDALAQSTLANLYAADKLTDKAMTRIRTSLALAPDDPNVLSNVGEAYEFMGDRAHAIGVYRKVNRKGLCA